MKTWCIKCQRRWINHRNHHITSFYVNNDTFCVVKIGDSLHKQLGIDIRVSQRYIVLIFIEFSHPTITECSHMLKKNFHATASDEFGDGRSLLSRNLFSVSHCNRITKYVTLRNNFINLYNVHYSIALYNHLLRILLISNDIETNPGPNPYYVNKNNLFICTYNIRGCKDFKKLKRIKKTFHNLDFKNNCIINLQETHLNDLESKKLENEWKLG